MNILVSAVMTQPPVTIPLHTTVPQAIKLMQSHGIRHLPVLDELGRVAGIVTERDLKEAMPSDSTVLSIWELTALLAKLEVRDVMSRSVLTVRDDTELRDAAYTMVKHKVGGLPVINDRNDLVGMLTSTDVMRAYVDLTGAGAPEPVKAAGTLAD
ncbi:CBS domain-containing protein [Deinococcus alpinitundrae]|uniref:CBS domain-containing protein n=1 Tax=Deinococcus alpinitundrae TaxID=468913 RepID=UPI00192A1BC1|nr:CBS domain-containing protein [Deinococcus alpinitundrae]